MPYYEFVNDKTGEAVLKKASFTQADTLIGRMRRKGFRQIYSPQRAIVGLSYYEALEETDELLAQADRGEGDLVRDASKERKRKATKFLT